MCWSQVSAHAGNNCDTLSFQRGILPILRIGLPLALKPALCLLFTVLVVRFCCQEYTGNPSQVSGPDSYFTFDAGQDNAVLRQPMCFTPSTAHSSSKTALAGGSINRCPESSARSSAMDNPPNANIHTIVKA